MSMRGAGWYNHKFSKPGTFLGKRAEWQVTIGQSEPLPWPPDRSSPADQPHQQAEQDQERPNDQPEEPDEDFLSHGRPLDPV
jgi:hypothetical protein